MNKNDDMDLTYLAWSVPDLALPVASLLINVDLLEDDWVEGGLGKHIHILDVEREQILIVFVITHNFGYLLIAFTCCWFHVRRKIFCTQFVLKNRLSPSFFNFFLVLELQVLGN